MTKNEIYNNLLKAGSFEKISEDNYNKIKHNFMEDNVTYIDYNDIQIPTRATIGSAGYDCRLTRDIILNPGESVVIPTFIRAKIGIGWMLLALPKSGLGFKYKLRLANTIGLIDSDYQYTVSDDNTNEGHIMIKLVNEGDKVINLSANSKFCQLVFAQYGVVDNEKYEDLEMRNGGIGSTGL